MLAPPKTINVPHGWCLMLHLHCCREQQAGLQAQLCQQNIIFCWVQALHAHAGFRDEGWPGAQGPSRDPSGNSTEGQHHISFQRMQRSCPVTQMAMVTTIYCPQANTEELWSGTAGISGSVSAGEAVIPCLPGCAHCAMHAIQLTCRCLMRRVLTGRPSRWCRGRWCPRGSRHRLCHLCLQAGRAPQAASWGAATGSPA